MKKEKTNQKKKGIATPTVATNLNREDLGLLSAKLGEEIAVVVIDEITSSYSHKIRAFIGK